MNLFEMMERAAGGNGLDGLARSYSLDPADMQRAVEALMPAFATGLSRNTQTPDALAAFMRALSSGRHVRYFDDPSTAAGGDGIREGNQILGHLFGSKDVSRAIADQANQATGLGTELMKQLLPVIANMVLGGLATQGSGSNPLIDEMLRQLQGSRRRGPLDRYEDEQEERQQSGGRAADPDPIARTIEEMFTGGTGSTPQRSPSGKDIFGDLFEPSRKMGEAYQQNMESIFDQFLTGMDRSCR